MNRVCNELPLQEVLAERCDDQTESQIQQHLETCSDCQRRLAELAADQPTWTQTARHLSTIKDLRLSTDIEQQLSRSSAFVVPTSEFPRVARRSGNDYESSGPSSPASWIQALDPPKHPEMLGQIDQFEIESKLGEGGMGIVLKGYDRDLNRAVAIKVLTPHLASNGTARKRFAREAQAAAAVVHPNVVPIYTVNQSKDRPYLVMQLVSGQSLQCLVDQEGPLDPKDVSRIAIQIADGLAAAHHQGLIHRDVKPANVLTERDASRVMITDFGLARAADDAGMTQTGWLAGTPHYMSPEQAKGDRLDPRSDLFSLGSLMYFLATGREPFRAERPYGVIQKIIHDPPTSPNVVSAEVPELLNRVILKLLEKNPADRFQSADAVADYLRDVLAHLQQPAVTKAPALLPKATQVRQQFQKWVLAGLVGLVVGAGLWVSLGGWPGFLFGDRTPAELSSEADGAPETLWSNESVLDDAAFESEMREAEQQLNQLERMFESTSVDPFPGLPAESQSSPRLNSGSEPSSPPVSNFNEKPLSKGMRNDD